MPIERVIGGVIYEFPDNTPEATIRRFEATKTGGAPASSGPAPARPSGQRPAPFSTGAGSQALQGLTMGFSEVPTADTAPVPAPVAAMRPTEGVVPNNIWATRGPRRWATARETPGIIAAPPVTTAGAIDPAISAPAAVTGCSSRYLRRPSRSAFTRSS